VGAVTKQGGKMSLEQQIGRLADVLEKIESKLDGGPKKKKGKKEEVVIKAAEVSIPIEESITPEEFLKTCNRKLLDIADTAVRTKKIAAIQAMLKKKYKIESIKAVPAESMTECANEIDAIIKEV